MQDIVELRQKLQEAANNLYEAYCPKIKPIYPWCVICVLPKSEKLGSLIYRADNVQTPIREAIVMETWEPHYKYDEVRIDGKWVERRHWIDLQIKKGDWILIPHSAGIPYGVVASSKEKHEFRLVRCDVHDYHGVLCGVEYDEKALTLSEVLNGNNGSEFKNVIEDIEEHFYVIPKVKAATYVSGA